MCARPLQSPIFLLFIAVSVGVVAAVLKIDDDLTNWEDYWAQSNSVVGVTASVNYYSSPIDGRYTAFRVSNCPHDSSACYQSELKNSTTLDVEGEHWFGVSSQLHDEWSYDSIIDNQISSYFFRILGSDIQSSSQFSLRYTGLSIIAQICGNNDLDSATEVCEEHNIGTPSPGIWDHWVIYNRFSHTTSGSVSVWRNGVNVLNLTSIVTSYRNTQAPTLTIGLYIDSWNTLAKALDWDATGLGVWMEIHIRRVKVGGTGSSYDEVYSGDSGDFTMGTEFLGTVRRKKL